MILARGGIIAPEHLPPPLLPLGTAGTSGGAAGALREDALAALVRGWAEAQLAGSEDSRNLYEQFLSLVEPPLLQAVLEHCGGQCLAAARRLGLHRTTLRKKLDQRGLGTVGSGQ
jgi:DNA-binding protein Fis